MNITLFAKRVTMFSLLALLSGAMVMGGRSSHAGAAGLSSTAGAADVPITTETVKLSDAAPKRLVGYGRAVAASGDTIAVGALYDTTSPDGESDGAVSVYVRNGSSWTLQQKLYFVNNHINDNFGCDVALSGDTLVVGARGSSINPANDFSTENHGAAVIFTRSNGRWTQQQVLRANDAQEQDYFGSYVAINGDTIAINNTRIDFDRSVYLFTRNGSTWTQQQKIPSFSQIALNSDTLVVKLLPDSVDNVVKIYTRVGNTWTPRQELRADPDQHDAGFGSGLAASEQYLVIGATGEVITPGNAQEGAVYIFARSGAGWVRKQKLVLEDRATNDNFGISVAIHNNMVVAGVLYDTGSARPNAGAAFVYTNNGTIWALQQQLGPSDGTKNDRFAQSVAVSGSAIVVGSPMNGQIRSPNTIPYIPGAAYVYNAPAAPARPVGNVSAASYDGQTLAPESIVTAFGSQLATSTQIATGAPPTQIAGTTVKVKDNAGVERMSPLLFVSPSQINYQLPAGTANGAATVTVTSGDGLVSTATVQINSIAPGLFTADASGRGLAAAVVLRVKANGAQSYEPIAHYDGSQNRFVAAPVDLGPAGDQVFLLLFGTGIRKHSGLSGVTARAGGTDMSIYYAGAQNDYVGLDQINALVPRSLAGRGELDVVLTVDGKQANVVRINVK